MNRLQLVPIGRPRGGHLKRLSVSLEAELDSQVSLDKLIIDHQQAYMPERGQYNSTELLRFIRSATGADTKVLGVTDLDITIPILTYVFGEAEVGGSAAVISICRLDPLFYGLPRDSALLERRIKVEALHELGHTFGLRHCPDWQCVMHSATDVEEIDVRGGYYCNNCREQVFQSR